MIRFSEKYCLEDFSQFLREFLPEDFSEKEEDIIISKERYKVIIGAKVLGFCDSLGLYVLEMEHACERDPRVAITMDAFKILADHWIHRALVAFKNNDSENYRLSYLTITLDLNDKNKAIKKYSNARRYSFYLGANAKIRTPEQQLVKKGRVQNIDDLLNRFSVEVVNKQFYLEVAKYFDELVSDDDKKLSLPSVSQENREIRKSFAVRLIGRLMFCWFLKQKKSALGQLIPDELLSSDVARKTSGYYHAVLEPLFFEVLNTSIEARDIRNKIFDQVPYLNGGLFNPQSEDYYELDRGVLFSRYINTLLISDAWFVNFFELLELYNFTIDENTVFDQELSVDPEMLGRIFENLLAEMNPETGNSERKRTGSFYTPRQVVEYMVDQSLAEYLKTKTGIVSAKIDALVSYDLSDDIEHPLSEKERRSVVNAIETLKILDPACGSGAFPIGALQKIVYILQTVDSDCVLWLDEKLKNVPELYKQKIISEVRSNPFDYTRKLDVIKNSIFGVDIQPIAVEVSRLRCFLTLVVESEIDDVKPNRGIEPLPNLDFKFVCANSLIPAPEQISREESLFGDEFQERLALAVDRYFHSSGENKRAANNEIHRLIDGKFDEKLKHLSGFVSYPSDEKLEAIRSRMNTKQIGEHSRILSLWSSYKNVFENKRVEFFETKYFFPSVKNRFDIVIGNPPYVQIQKFARTETQANLEQVGYKTFEKTGDVYTLFFERGLELTKSGTGLLSFITSNKWMRAGYGGKLRGYFAGKNPLQLLDFGGFKVFESATVDTSIMLIENKENRNTLLACHFKNDYQRGESLQEYFKARCVNLKNLSSETWFIGDPAEIALKEKIEKRGKPLKEWDVKINFGIKTGLNEAFIIDQATRDRLVAEDPKSADIIKPILRGRDIKRYGYEWAGLYVIVAKFGSYKTIQKKYTAIYEHLSQYEKQLKERGQCKYSRTGKNGSSSDYKGQHHWLELDNNPKDEYLEMFEKEKVVWKRIGSVIRFTLVQDKIYAQDSTCIMAGDNVKLLAAVLNSSFGNYLLQDSPRTGTSDLILSVQAIDSIYVPDVTLENKSIVEQIEAYVDQILSAKKENPKADTSAWEKEIDRLVYELYGLTEEEIMIVEGN